MYVKCSREMWILILLDLNSDRYRYYEVDVMEEDI